MTEEALTRDQAAEILRETMPGADVIGIERMALGAVSGAYEVLCEDPAQNVVLKLYGRDYGWRLSKEISIYRLLRENGITKIPKLLGAAGSDGLLGRPYLLMSKLPGARQVIGSSMRTLIHTSPSVAISLVFARHRSSFTTTSTRETSSSRRLRTVRW
jgi:hypothetical protein